MTRKSTHPRQTWERLVAGEDVGPMVSPLCDNWALDIPYRWPFSEPEPFPAGHPQHALCQQMAMAEVCGWTPSFLAGIPFPPRSPDIKSETKVSTCDGVTRTETRIQTPYGPLTSTVEAKTSSHALKRMLESEEDYRRMTWYTRELANYDEAQAIAEGRKLRDAVGDRGVLGTWASPPAMNVDRDNMWYHLADWPEACAELHQASLELLLRQLPTYRQAGLDYLFYCVDGTEWISPAFCRERIIADTQLIFKHWRELGGFILWHSCGRVKQFVEAGFYNQCLPEVFETLSEPPVGNLPALAWAREKLDRRIVTKGNLPLNILLQGTEDDVRAGVRRIRDATRSYRHIVGLTDDVLAETPLRNARAFVDEALR